MSQEAAASVSSKAREELRQRLALVRIAKPEKSKHLARLVWTGKWIANSLSA